MLFLLLLPSILHTQLIYPIILDTIIKRKSFHCFIDRKLLLKENTGKIQI